jgi:hypothetical protein
VLLSDARVTGSCLLLSQGHTFSKNLQVLEFCEEYIHMMVGIQSPKTHRLQQVNDILQT